MVIPFSASRFPSNDPGFAALTVDEVLAANADIIARIKLCYGLNRETFESEVLGLIRRYAAYVHLLPATAHNYFSTPGGLLRLGLETGFFSLQGTDAHIFSGRSTISTRSLLEPRWRHAAFIAGLCSEVHRTFSHMLVTNLQGEVWSAFLQPLAGWLETSRAARYFVSWRSQAFETRSLGVFALPHLLAPQMLQDLSLDNDTIVPHLMASIGGLTIYRDRNVLDKLVRRSLALVIERHLATNADRYGLPQLGAHVERYLVDALRRLACSSSAWVCNHDKSRVWFGQDGLFLLWPNAAEDICKLLEAEQLPGIPKTAETMLELLLAAAVFEAQDAAHPTWRICPPHAKMELEAVKLTSAAILFAGIDPPPVALQMTLVHHPDKAAPPPPAAAAKRPMHPGEQLPLIPADASSQATASDDGWPQKPMDPMAPIRREVPAPAAPQPSFTLKAPLRLNPLVRDALEAVIQSMNQGAGPAPGCTVAQGFFIPISELERRGLQPSMALRALADAGMLVRTQPDGPPTQSLNFNGILTLGTVIHPRFIAGFDLAEFPIQDAGDH